MLHATWRCDFEQLPRIAPMVIGFRGASCLPWSDKISFAKMGTYQRDSLALLYAYFLRNTSTLGNNLVYNYILDTPHFLY